MKRKEILFLVLISLMLSLIADCAGPSVPIINSFSAVPSTITEGESTILSWSVTDATSVTIDPGIGSKPLIGSIVVSPTVTTTYTLTTTNSVGSVTATAVVIVNPTVPAYGSIDIKSTPPGAKVYFDGIDTEKVTPTVIPSVEVGIHTIKLDKFHYKICEDNNIIVNAGATTYFVADLTYVSAKTIILQPGPEEGKDAYVLSYYPDINFGSSVVLEVGNRSSSPGRTYLQFDLSSVPEGARIIDAYLKLYQFTSYGLGSFTVGLYQVTSNWGEDYITYNNQPDSSTEAEASCKIYAGTAWKSWDYIDELVKNWFDGSITNYGLLLKATNETSINNEAAFRSSDYTINPSQCPKLEIHYYIP